MSEEFERVKKYLSELAEYFEDLARNRSGVAAMEKFLWSQKAWEALNMLKEWADAGCISDFEETECEECGARAGNHYLTCPKFGVKYKEQT